MVIKRATVCLLAAIVLALPAVSLAQSERGGISGVVADSTKAALPGVAVTITNTATNQATRDTFGRRLLTMSRDSAALAIASVESVPRKKPTNSRTTPSSPRK